MDKLHVQLYDITGVYAEVSAALKECEPMTNTPRR